MNVEANGQQGRIALICGGGDLPVQAYHCLCERKEQPLVIEFHEQPCRLPPDYQGSLGQVGQFIHFLKQNNVKRIVMLGHFNRPVWRRLRFDLTGIYYLPRVLRLLRRGDNGLMRGLVKIFEEMGFTMPDPETLFPSMLAPPECMTKATPTLDEQSDIDIAVKALQALSPFDIGQGCVIDRGRFLAIEAAQGTQAMLQQVCDLPQTQRYKLTNRSSGILVKLMKTGQERRGDLPTVGLETLQQIHAAGLRGLVVHAGSSFILDLHKMIAYANQHNLFIMGVTIPDTD